jgi:SAM-dependent methyltransferase
MRALAREPIDVPTAETIGFVSANLPAGAELLEVGCGEGQVGAGLKDLGYRVVGIDSEGELVAKARRRGVEAQRATWPDYEGGPFDAVVFTRSIHHIHPLQPAVAKAYELLKGPGVVLVEDFAFDEADKRTIKWFLDIVRCPKGRSLITAVSGEFVTDLLAANKPEALWHHQHDHELHDMSAITMAIGEKFPILNAAEVPYLYRYLIPVLPATVDSANFVNEVFREEARLGAQREIVLIGRRIAAGKSL